MFIRIIKTLDLRIEVRIERHSSVNNSVLIYNLPVLLNTQKEEAKDIILKFLDVMEGFRVEYLREIKTNIFADQEEIIG